MWGFWRRRASCEGRGKERGDPTNFAGGGRVRLRDRKVGRWGMGGVCERHDVRDCGIHVFHVGVMRVAWTVMVSRFLFSSFPPSLPEVGRCGRYTT